MVELKKTTKLAWRRFLQSDAGQEGMLYLREKIPGIQKGEQHAMVYDAGYTQGFIRAIDTIPDLIAGREQEHEGSADNE